MGHSHPAPAPRRNTRGKALRRTGRLAAVDAARGLALIGLTAIHFLPTQDEETDEPTWSWILFSGDSAALLALLAGVGLALFSGGRTPRHGRRMTADRIAVTVRASLIFILGMSLRYLMPADTPAVNILVYYGVFFLLAVPFLHLPPKALFLLAAVFGMLSPVMILGLRGQLPSYTAYNPTFTELFGDPGATITQLLVTGAYPALSYMTYLLVGLGVGRLDLRHRRVHIGVLATGIGLALLARVISWILLYALGGYHQLLHNTGAQSAEELDYILVFGPDSSFTVSWWWLAITTPHTNTTLAITSSLGTGLIVLGVFLLASEWVNTRFSPLSAIGTMTLTLYSAQLVLLSFRLHDDQPWLWFIIYLTSATLFAVGWQRAFGQGPLEWFVSMAAKGAGNSILSPPAGATRS